MAGSVTSWPVSVTSPLCSTSRSRDFGEHFQADVAAHLGPLVVSFGEHGADRAGEPRAARQRP
jgi:hypothetical protein